MVNIRRVAAAVAATLSAAAALTLTNAAPAHATCEVQRTVTISDTRRYEGTGAGTTFFAFTVSTVGCDNPGSVNYTTAAGSATPGTDYLAPPPGTITWAAGDTSSKTIVVGVIKDAADEPNETFTVNLSNPTGFLVISDATGLGTILDDDGPIKWNIDDQACFEGSPSGLTACQFTIGVSKPSAVAMTVKLTTLDNTAKTSDQDYVAILNQTVNFAQGQTTAVATVWLEKDVKCEGDDNLWALLSSPSVGSLADGAAVITILNDDFFC